MRTLTLNLWHGLYPSGRLTFSPLEPEIRLTRRYELQHDLLRQLALDVAFLQEVNPLMERKAALAAAAGLVPFVQPDLVGVKLRGIGWPPKLNSGLMTLVKAEWSPRLIGGLKLSGSGWAVTTTFFSLQGSETRYALLVEALHPRWGRLLLVNAHLHHGLELDDSLKEQIHQLAEQGVLTGSAAAELKDRVNRANQRRRGEVNTLLDHLRTIENRYALIILGGDLNFVPESDSYAALREHGFRDLWLDSCGSDPGFTFDSQRNHANHIFTERFPLTVETDDLSFSPKARKVVADLLRGHEHRRRRVDYVFSRERGQSIQNPSAELIGIPNAESDLAPSDHFGVLVSWP